MQSLPVSGPQGRSATVLVAVFVVAAGALFFVTQAAGPDRILGSRDPGTFAEIRIHQKRPTLLSDVYAREQDFETYRRTHAKMLKGYFVLQSALRSSEIDRLELIKQQRRPMEWLEENLVIEFPDTEFIRLSLRGRDSAEAAAILNAVVRAYKREVVDKEEEQRRTRLIQLEKIAAGVHAEIDRLRADFRRQREVMAAPSPGIEMLDLEAIRKQYTDLRLKRTQLEAERAADQEQPDGESTTVVRSDGIEHSKKLERLTRRTEAIESEFRMLFHDTALSSLALAEIDARIARKRRLLDQLHEQIEKMTIELNAPIGIEVYREATAVD